MQDLTFFCKKKVEILLQSTCTSLSASANIANTDGDYVTYAFKGDHTDAEAEFTTTSAE